MNISPVGSSAQEAMETAAQTRAESAQGDVQAKLKLALMAKLQPHTAQAAAVATNATPDSKAAASAPSSSPAASATAAVAAPSTPPPPAGAVFNVKQ
jgi:hypothetical protein